MGICFIVLVTLILCLVGKMERNAALSVVLVAFFLWAASHASSNTRKSFYQVINKHNYGYLIRPRGQMSIATATVKILFMSCLRGELIYQMSNQTVQ